MILFLLACPSTPDNTVRDSAVAPLPERTLLVAPYLQSTTPDSTAILWITDEGEESRVAWGLTAELGESAEGTADIEGGTGVVHSVSLTGLPPGTDIYYQAHTDGTATAIHRFHTPPPAGAEDAFVILAMSDMQRDDSNPDKFAEIIEDGILPYIADTYGGEPADHVGMVLIPGDLVDNGWLYTDWWDEFFAPAAPLLAQTTVWPVLGNHESNTALYFRYFQLPENSTPGYEEHWWSADYGRVRVFGLDSNGAYASDTQLVWLDEQLEATCADDGIDIAIAQLHPPSLSEVWIPGELDFTGEVIARMEAFTEACGRPSVHLFGHTHAYSRGQSRDHRHLWVNVASAGGSIDAWGGSDEVDYEEFTVSQDEWGFVAMEIDPDAITLTRISHGNSAVPRDNEVRDTVRIPLSPQAPQTPDTLEAVVGDVVVLSASAFSDDGLHGASHWEVSTSCDDFSTPLVSRWIQHENQFGGVDLQEGDDLTDVEITELVPGSYCWRVRYRDRGLTWSDWSSTASLSVPD